MNQNVNELVDPLQFRNNVDINGLDGALLIDMLRKMIIIRKQIRC